MDRIGNLSEVFVDWRYGGVQLKGGIEVEKSNKQMVIKKMESYKNRSYIREIFVSISRFFFRLITGIAVPFKWKKISKEIHSQIFSYSESNENQILTEEEIRTLFKIESVYQNFSNKMKKELFMCHFYGKNKFYNIVRKKIIKKIISKNEKIEPLQKSAMRVINGAFETFLREKNIKIANLSSLKKIYIELAKACIGNEDKVKFDKSLFLKNTNKKEERGDQEVDYNKSLAKIKKEKEKLYDMDLDQTFRTAFHGLIGCRDKIDFKEKIQSKLIFTLFGKERRGLEQKFEDAFLKFFENRKGKEKKMFNNHKEINEWIKDRYETFRSEVFFKEEDKTGLKNKKLNLDKNLKELYLDYFKLRSSNWKDRDFYRKLKQFNSEIIKMIKGKCFKTEIEQIKLGRKSQEEPIRKK